MEEFRLTFERKEGLTEQEDKRTGLLSQSALTLQAKQQQESTTSDENRRLFDSGFPVHLSLRRLFTQSDGKQYHKE